MTPSSGSTAPLQTILAKVSAGRMSASVATLASDDFAGRRLGTGGGAAARAWLTDHLAALGATVETDEFPVRAVPDVYASPTVTWDDDTTSTPLVFGREVAVHSASSDTVEVRRGPLGVAGSDAPTGRWLVVPAGTSIFDAFGHAQGAAGLALHERAGFRVIGVRERVGHHDGRWRDVVLLERRSPVVT
jgi:hypothetical protein